MLELKGITKVYPTGSEPVTALRGIDLTFRDSEFVSVLGPSGCGKTTMLNILGGLDGYTEGDLIINGVSTKQYKARDWDAYRNHSVGFVFQSYNLIPHQSVLHNVELALTLSGVSKRERRRRARAALERVGLGDQLRKKPGQLSGGQMQRVAIARAIVNDPDIILADEPTGALDTETSVQVMEILKEIADDRLVVMVTHNPDLAEQYSTRIVRMLDGRITDDSAPLSEEETAASAPAEQATKRRKGRKKKPSMSFATSFGLSLKNLFTKKGRTILTSFAGSIGIIGIALIYAVSQGTNDYIDAVQEQTLISYPLTIESKPIDLFTLLAAFADREENEEEHGEDAVYQKAMLYNLMNDFASLEDKTNDLRSFKAFLEERKADPESKLGAALTGVKYSYAPELLIYTEGVDGVIRRSDTTELMRELMSEYMGVDLTASVEQSRTGFGTGSSLMTSSASLWRELLSDNDGEPVNEVTKKQYRLLYGSWPEKYDEVVLFVDKNNQLNDLTLYALGLKSKEEMSALMKASANKEVVEYEDEKWSYEEVCGMELRTILPADCYNYDEKTGTYTDLRETDAGMKYLYDNGLTLKIVGIVKPDETAVSDNQAGGVGYTSALTAYLAGRTEDAGPVKAQKADPDADIFTGLPFKGDGKMTDADKAAFFREHVASLDEAGKAALYVRVLSVPDEEEVEAYVEQMMAAVDRERMEQQMLQAISEQTGMAAENVKDYLSSMSDEQMSQLFADSVRQAYRRQYAEGVLSRVGMLSPAQMAAALDEAAAGYTDEEGAALYDEVLTFSDSDYESNLNKLGVIDLDAPSAIRLYASTFENKDVIVEAIADYNDGVEELKKIEYTDYVGLIMSSVTTIINAIAYVLIAFVAVSLIVSSIMIGVITLISVQERTKEIGILRAIGASKRNVSNMFNAETLIIGFTSGLLGVAITYLLCIPINAILHDLTGIQNLSAHLPVPAAAALVLVSMLLTLIAGIIPSRSAAKKDPVVALRTE